MIKLKDFLKIANNDVVITDGCMNMILLSRDFFDSDILSENILNAEICKVKSMDKQLIVELVEEDSDD